MNQTCIGMGYGGMEYGVWKCIFHEPDMGYGNSYIFLHGLGVLLLGQLEALELCPHFYELPLKPRLHVLRVNTTRVRAMRGWGEGGGEGRGGDGRGGEGGGDGRGGEGGGESRY